MSFIKFLVKHSQELSAIAKGFDTLAGMVTGDKGDKQAVLEASKAVKEASASIANSIDEVKELVEIKVSKDEVQQIVAELLPDLIAKALANAANPPKPKRGIPK